MENSIGIHFIIYALRFAVNAKIIKPSKIKAFSDMLNFYIYHKTEYLIQIPLSYNISA